MYSIFIHHTAIRLGRTLYSLHGIGGLESMYSYKDMTLLQDSRKVTVPRDPLRHEQVFANLGLPAERYGLLSSLPVTVSTLDTT